jgi:hypothetical protein
MELPYVQLKSAASSVGIALREALDAHRHGHLVVSVWLEARLHDKQWALGLTPTPEGSRPFWFELRPDELERGPARLERGLHRLLTDALDPLLQGERMVETEIPFVWLRVPSVTAFRLVEPLVVGLEGLLVDRQEWARFLGCREQAPADQTAASGPGPQSEAVSPVTQEPNAGSGLPRLDRMGDVWAISYRGREEHFSHLDGFIYVAALVQFPGKRISAVCLHGKNEVPSAWDEAFSNPGAASPIQLASCEDSKAHVKSYDAASRKLKKRMQRPGLPDRARESFKEQLADLEKFRNKETRPGGFRADPSSPVEKSRRPVGNAIDRAIQSIKTKLPELAEHLRDAIAHPSGGRPAYLPSVGDEPPPRAT